MHSQVRRLVLVESTALFDTSGIDLKPNKAVKVKNKGLLTHAGKKNSTVQSCAANASRCLMLVFRKRSVRRSPHHLTGSGPETVPWDQSANYTAEGKTQTLPWVLAFCFLWLKNKNPHTC